MALKQVTGTCRFCGQESIMEVFPDETEDVINEKATRACVCKAGNGYRLACEREENRKAAIISAKGTTFELFNKEHPEIEEIFNNSMEALTKKKIKSISIDTGEKVKAKIKYQAGMIRIERIDTASYKRETEVE